MESLVEISQFCFHLEDMRSITPFWEWIDNRIRPQKIYLISEEQNVKDPKKADKTQYLEPEELEEIIKGVNKADDNEFLIMGILRRESDVFCEISGIYQDEEQLPILDINAQRLSDHRFKVEITYWDPDGWPTEALWNYFYRLMKDLSHDYPEIIATLRNSYLGYLYSPLDNQQNLDMLGIEEELIEINSSSLNNTKTVRRPSGRKHLRDDVWAYIEVNKKHREPSEVYKEWIKKPGVMVRNLQDSSRMFKLIIKPDWL